MKMKLKVKLDDGSAIPVTIGMADLVALERETNKSVQEYFQNWNVSDTCFLAWHAIQRKDKATPEFDAWLDGVDEITTDDIEAEPVPLESSPTTSN
jgi:hypothetical protein